MELGKFFMTQNEVVIRPKNKQDTHNGIFKKRDRSKHHTAKSWGNVCKLFYWKKVCPGQAGQGGKGIM